MYFQVQLLSIKIQCKEAGMKTDYINRGRGAANRMKKTAKNNHVTIGKCF